jgi:hypothetical protein
VKSPARPRSWPESATIPAVKSLNREILKDRGVFEKLEELSKEGKKENN